MQAYWNEIEVVNAKFHVAPDFAVRLNVGLPATKHFADVPYFKNPFFNLNLEMHALAAKQIIPMLI